MIRKSLAVLALTATTAGLLGSNTASASTVGKPNPLTCVGAAEHKQAQSLRLQAAQADLAALQLRKTASVGRAAATARIDGRIAKVTARIAKIQANQVKFAARCP
jgi:hypothetical protein